jgi:Tfp pilus assembly protein PilF
MRIKMINHGIAVIGIAVLAFFAVASTGTTPSARETAEMYNRRGNEYAEENNWWEAYEAYTKAIELAPDFADAYFGRGRANLGLNEPRKAINDFSKCIELNPKSFGACINRGLMYKHLGNIQAYTNAYGYPTNTVGTSNVSELTRALEYYALALSDFNRALESNNSNIQQSASAQIAEVQKKKDEVETVLAASTAQTRAREETNRYDPANFTFDIPHFKPADYTPVDLFRAASNSRNLQRASSRQEAILSQMQSSMMGGLGGNFMLEYVSDLTFVSQDGTDIIFSSDDNAIRQTMTIAERSGLQTGQRVKVYYEITRSPLTTWIVDAIERR